MRKRSAIPFQACLALLICANVLPSTALFAADKKTKAPKESRRSETRQIEGLETLWRTAIVSGDATIMDKLLSDDFLAISARGTLSDKQQYLQRIASHATQLSACDLMDLKVHVQLRSAVAVSQARVQGMLEGHPIDGTFRYTKVYARGAGGTWRMTNFEATRVSPSAASQSDMDQGLPLEEKNGRRASH